MGKQKAATHKIIVCDTFSYEDYEVLAYGLEDLEEKKNHYSLEAGNMQKVHEIIELNPNQRKS